MVLLESGHTAHSSSDLADCDSPAALSESSEKQPTSEQPDLSTLDLLPASQAAARLRTSQKESVVTAGATPFGCVERNCCQDSSCSTSGSGQQQQQSSSLGPGACCSQRPHEQGSDDDTGLPQIDLPGAELHQSLRQPSWSQSRSRELSVQPEQSDWEQPPSRKSAAVEPLLEDNDDRFCLFPIK